MDLTPPKSTFHNSIVECGQVAEGARVSSSPLRKHGRGRGKAVRRAVQCVAIQSLAMRRGALQRSHKCSCSCSAVHWIARICATSRYFTRSSWTHRPHLTALCAEMVCAARESVVMSRTNSRSQFLSAVFHSQCKPASKQAGSSKAQRDSFICVS